MKHITRNRSMTKTESQPQKKGLTIARKYSSKMRDSSVTILFVRNRVNWRNHTGIYIHLLCAKVINNALSVSPLHVSDAIMTCKSYSLTFSCNIADEHAFIIDSNHFSLDHGNMAKNILPCSLQNIVNYFWLHSQMVSTVFVFVFIRCLQWFLCPIFLGNIQYFKAFVSYLLIKAIQNIKYL